MAFKLPGTKASPSLRGTVDPSFKIRMARTLHFNQLSYEGLFGPPNRKSVEHEKLMRSAIHKCEDETVLQWLKQNSQSAAFEKLGEMFNFIKKHINEEEKKDHGDNIDIIFMAHGAIRDSLIPACCLLPLPTVTDVILYSPWNCTLNADAAYGIAAGVMKPQHRVFNCSISSGCPTPNGEHLPAKLPNHWNSMKRAGEEAVPNITLSPLNPPKDGYLNKFETFTKKHGLPERNRIIIQYIIPADKTSQQETQSVPFYVVSLALSLALVGSRFKATIHLVTCLGDRSAGRKFDKEYLKNQYACTVDNTMMTASPDMFKKRLFLNFWTLFET
ncbi:uncharacterized protein LOC117832678 [Notolabrus celidotus]|uniref:uncharacterized protein LOC117832678 n=1 Tax=Notolabrus celidotus TaxID=1203425 RepID=UPI00148FCF1A|nr:uncharacterized protein LOC117832678 [Notolabrus celidotus]